MAISPTQRTLAECRKRGWLAYVTEKWIAQARRRVDAFGFGDVLVLDGDRGSLLVQACRTADAATRRTKIIEECTDNARRWLAAGNRIEVWGWAKRGAAGKRKLWTLARWRIRRGGEPMSPTETIEVANDGTVFNVERVQ